MHAIEGILAAMTLLIYFYTAAMPPLQNSDWTHNAFKQSGTEYLDAVEKANLSETLLKNSDVFSAITRHLFESPDISVMEKGIPPKYIRIGIATSHSSDPIIDFYDTSLLDADICLNTYGWNTEFACIINNSNPLGKEFVLADTNGGKDFDNALIYDSIYVDMNNNGLFDAGEGPFFANDNISIAGSTYYVGYVDDAAKSVALWNAAPILKFRERASPVNINGRASYPVFYGADLSRELEPFDVLVISGPINLVPYSAALKEFLGSGGGIVEIANITAANYNAAQQDIFGIANESYGIAGNSIIVRTSVDHGRESEPIKIGNYFSGISMRATMSPYASPPYYVNDLPSPQSARVGFLNVSGINISIAIANSTPLRYDKLYIDTNWDYNFSRPPSDYLSPYSEGGTFFFNSDKYTIKHIDPLGAYVDIRPEQNMSMVNFFNPLIIASDGRSWAAAEEENTYFISTYSIGDSFTINLLSAPVLGDNTTLPQGYHVYGSITPLNSNIVGRSYNISVTNTSSTLLLNIDLNHDSQYNGYGEGPFAEKESAKIGPEEYKANLKSGSYSATFTLLSREKAPASIASEKYSGRTVWMPDITNGGQDSWNYITSAIVWASESKGYASTTTYQNIISSRKAFILNNDMYQPYIVELSRGYK